MSNSLSRPYADYFPFGVSLRVPNMQYAADVTLSGPYCAKWVDLLALDADGILDGVVMVNGSAVTVNTFTSGAASATQIAFNGLVPLDSTTVRSYWGRGLSVVADAACTRTATITGYDYLGSKMVEVLTINGTTPVLGVKAFAWIESVVFSSSTDTAAVDVGWTNKLGVPYKLVANQGPEIKDEAVAANAGTFVAGLADATAATGTNADVRGTYLPVTVIPNG